MHYAQLKNSKRLQRLLKVLEDGQKHSTFDIITEAKICAVNSAVAELRANGFNINCKRIAKNIWQYWMGN